MTPCLFHSLAERQRLLQSECQLWVITKPYKSVDGIRERKNKSIPLVLHSNCQHTVPFTGTAEGDGLK